MPLSQAKVSYGPCSICNPTLERLVEMQGIIDRFEGEYALVEFDGKKMKNIPRTILPDGCKEGDVIRLQGETYVIHAGSTARLKKKIEDLALSLWE